MKTPLADRIRPKTLDEVVGQKHLIGEGKILRNIIENDEVPNMIFYGPSGVGKTTIANIIAQKTGKTLHRLNATTASVADIKNIVSTLDSFLAMDGVCLLYTSDAADEEDSVDLGGRRIIKKKKNVNKKKKKRLQNSE